jgi:uncharacterized membrane protein YccC
MISYYFVAITAVIQVTPIPTLVTTQNPREGMNALINSTLSEGTELIPSTRSTDNLVRIETFDPYGQGTQQNVRQPLNTQNNSIQSQQTPNTIQNNQNNDSHSSPLNVLHELMQQFLTMNDMDRNENVNNNTNFQPPNPSPPVLSSSLMGTQSSSPSLL